jgi:ubiquinol-cytochrome c reductase iron-sulfur subunit
MAETSAVAAHEGETRRDFLYVATAAAAVVGTGAALWPMVDSMNPSADVLALATTEVDLAPIEPGQAITVVWQSKPVFVRHRTAEEIAAAENVDVADLREPQTDAERVQRPEWLILIGICTHLGCIPLGEKGEFGGWLCPCHGSHYDTSGRIRKGPAPENLKVPPYAFTSDTTIVIG